MSTGFATLTAGGYGRLLSAGHCDPTGNREIWDGVGTERISTGDGQVSVIAADLDTMIIDPISPSGVEGTIGKVFGGPWNAGTGHSRYQFFVGGSAPPSQGEDVCNSGAVTGEHCNRNIAETGVTFPCWTNSSRSCVGFRTTGTGVGAGAGDSGGPMYIMRTDGRVGARGIIIHGQNLVACGGTSQPTNCYSTIHGVGIHRILDRWGVRIET